jgi:ribonuclease HI
MKITIHTDGGSRGNPGLAAAAFVVLDSSRAVFFEKGQFLGQKTNNDAEYEAFQMSLLWALENCVKSTPEKVEKIEWKLDSMLVVEQLNKKWKIKEPRLRQFAENIWTLLEKLPCEFTIGYVPRAENYQPDALVNATLDKLTPEEMKNVG